MKNIIASFIVGVLYVSVLVSAPQVLNAQSGAQPTGSNVQPAGSAVQPVGNRPAPVIATGGIENPLKGANSLGELFKTLSQFVLDLAYIVIAAFLLLSGFKFIKAQGNPEEIAKAKETFWYTIIGALIIIAMDTMVGVFKRVLEQLAS